MLKIKMHGLVVLWVKLMRNGYTRSITSLYRVMQRLEIYKKAPSKKKKYIPKPYEQMTHPGERIQIDVKYVPSNCLTKELKEQEESFYQYTAIDEYTSQRVLWASMNKDIFFVEISAIIVFIILLTRLPMKRSERPTVSTSSC